MEKKQLSGASKRRQKKLNELKSAAKDPRQAKIHFLKDDSNCTSIPELPDQNCNTPLTPSFYNIPSTSQETNPIIINPDLHLVSKILSDSEASEVSNIPCSSSSCDVPSRIFEDSNNILTLETDCVKHSKAANQNIFECAANSGHKKYLSDDDSDSEPNLPVISGTESASLFKLPLGCEFSYKLEFLKAHPIQPTDVPFIPSKIYFSTLPDGSKLQRKWLSFCKVQQRMYCATCIAFGSNDSPFIVGVDFNNKRITRQLETHEKSKSHLNAYETLLRHTRKNTIESYLSTQNELLFETKKSVLERIVKIVILFCKQGISFRAHRNEGIYDLALTEKGNHGNFLEFVKIMAEYDPILCNHLNECIRKSCKKNESGKKGRGNFVSFLSKSYYNKIISVIGNMIKHKISSDLLEVGQFSIAVDSTQDTAVKEQLSICVRYVKEGNVNERLLSLISIKSSTGEAIYTEIKQEFEKLGLSLSKLVGHSFDGAANMSGQYNGLQAHLKKDAPDSIFVHCYAHVLNLVLSDATSCCIDSQNLFSLINKTGVFFSSSYKRANIWEDFLNNRSGVDRVTKLKKIGATRWSSRHESLKSIFHSWVEKDVDRKRFVCLLECLHFLGFESPTIDPETSSEARSLLLCWSSFKTIFTSFIYLQIFYYSSPVSNYLQTKGLNYHEGYKLITELIHQILKLQSTDTNFDLLKMKTSSLVNVVENSLSHLSHLNLQTEFDTPRPRKKKKMPGELADDEGHLLSGERQFKVGTYKPIIDHLLNALIFRYKKNEHIFNSLTFFHGDSFHTLKQCEEKLHDAILFVSNKTGLNNTVLKEELLRFSEFFLNKDFQIDEVELEPMEVEAEGTDSDGLIENDNSRAMIIKRHCTNCIQCLYKYLYNHSLNSLSFSNLFVAYKYILTLSCTQVHCERVFSKLKIIKTRLRSTLSQGLLEHLVLISVENDLIPDSKDIVKQLL